MRTKFSRVPWPFKMMGALILVPGMLLLITWAAWMLWNALMPVHFGLTALTYWQMMGLLVLVKLIFSGPGMHGFPHAPVRPKPWFKDRNAWRRHMNDRFGSDEHGFHRGPYGRPDRYGRYNGRREDGVPGNGPDFSGNTGEERKD